MRNRTYFFAASLALLATFVAQGAPTPSKLPTDNLQIGKPATSADKQITFDTNDGVGNPVLGVEKTTKDLKYNKNKFSLGDGLSSVKTLEANLGGTKPQLRYDPAAQEWQFSNDGTNFDSFGSGSGGSAGVNVLRNPGFESGIAVGWTNTGGTFAAVSSGSNLLIGKGSATFTASAGGQSFESNLYPVPNGLVGGNCAAGMLYLGGSSNLVFEALDGSSNVLNFQTLSAQTIPTAALITFPCPPAGQSFRTRVRSTASSALIATDQFILGELPTLQVSQTSYFGGITFPRTNSCLWSWTPSVSPNFSTAPADTDCVGAVTRGFALAPTSLVPALRFASLPVGRYLFVVPSMLNNNQNGSIAWRISDGASVHTTRVVQPLTGQFNVNTGSTVFQLDVTSPLSNIQLGIYASGTAGGQGAEINNDLLSGVIPPDFAIDVYRYPTAAEAAYRMDTVNVFAAIKYPPDADRGAATTSGTFVTFNDASLAVGRVLEGVAVAPSVANDLAIQATLEPGNYEISYTGPLEASGTNQTICNYRLHDGTDTIASSRINTADVAVTRGSNGNLIGTKRYSARTTVTINLQGQRTTGTGSCGVNVSLNGGIASQFTIKRLDQPMPAALVSNGVVSPSLGVERIARATLTNTGTCAVVSQSGGWISGTTDPGVGACDVQFAPGTFSSAPACFCTPNALINTGLCRTSVTPTTSGVRVSTLLIDSLSPANLSNADIGFDLLCIGPR